MNHLRETLEKYLILDRQYRDYINQFFNIAWDGQKIKIPPKVFNREEIAKIKKMKHELDDAHSEWFKALNN